MIFICNICEVNVIVTRLFIKSTSKIARGCTSINVVSNGFLLINDEILESLVEVSFDLCEKNSRGRKKVVKKVVHDEDDDYREYELERLEDELLTPKYLNKSDEIFDRVVKKPYLHYLFTSRIDFKIHYLNTTIFCYKSIVVRSPALFKNQYGTDSRIFIAENGTILFCGCHRYSEGDTIIQAPNGECKNYDIDKEDCEKFDYELPSKVFKHLYKFISQINKGKDIIIKNFEILVRCCEKEPENEPESFKVGKLTFYKLIPSSVKLEIEHDKRAKRSEILERNFDKRDD